jgi:hypothetical protein
MWVRIHDINFTIVDFGNFVFYFGFTYFLLRIRGQAVQATKTAMRRSSVPAMDGEAKTSDRQTIARAKT